MNWIKLFIFILFISNIFALSKDEDKKYDELEGFPFIRALFLDKKYSEVIKFGQKLNIEQENIGDLNYFLAESHFQLKEFQMAFDILERSASFPKSNSNQFYLTFARTHFHLNQFNKCIEKLNLVNRWVYSSNDWTLFSLCHEKNNQPKDLIAHALNINTGDFDFFLESQNILLKYGLLQIAKEKRHDYLSKCFKINDYLSLFTLINKYQVKDEFVYESAHRCHPSSVELDSHLIKSHFTNGFYHSLAYSFSELSRENSDFYKHTSEFYKIANRDLLSEYFSTLADEDTFVLAKTERYLKKENFALLFSLPIKKESLQNKPDLSYAKAYSELKYLQMSLAKSTIELNKKKTSKEEGFLSLVSKCYELGWKCRP